MYNVKYMAGCLIYIWVASASFNNHIITVLHYYNHPLVQYQQQDNNEQAVVMATPHGYNSHMVRDGISRHTFMIIV